jgi:hypothetical protein
MKTCQACKTINKDTVSVCTRCGKKLDNLPDNTKSMVISGSGDDYIHQVVRLRGVIRKLESRCNKAETDLAFAESGMFDEFVSVQLYCDRVVGSEQTLPLKQGLTAHIETSGSRFATTDVRSTSRPTVTRAVIGGLVASFLGAAAASTFGQKGEIETHSRIHDDRHTYLIIQSSDGHISAAFPPNMENRAREFASKINETERESVFK